MPPLPAIRPFPGALTLKEAAEHLELSVSYLDALRAQKRGPPFEREAGCLWARAADLDAWLASRTNEARLANIRRLVAKGIELNGRIIASIREDAEALINPHDPSEVQRRLDVLRATRRLEGKL